MGKGILGAIPFLKNQGDVLPKIIIVRREKKICRKHCNKCRTLKTLSQNLSVRKDIAHVNRLNQCIWKVLN